MRRFIAVAVAVVALFGAITPASAQMPAPKVTINGLIDFATSVSKNWSGFDVTDGGKDHLWYSRERGVFTFTGEVGRTKGVWAVELDFVNGAGGTVASGNSANFDMDTDVPGQVETKWLYVETPITGPGSIMPFIPVPTILRAGAQPARGHEYKFGILFGGDFPGVTLETAWAPNLKSTVTYAQIGEGLDTVNAPNRAINNEDFAILGSVEFEVFKGLTVKPTYSYASYTCGNGQGSANLGTEAKNGFNPNVCDGLNNLKFDTRPYPRRRRPLDVRPVHRAADVPVPVRLAGARDGRRLLEQRRRDPVVDHGHLGRFPRGPAQHRGAVHVDARYVG